MPARIRSAAELPELHAPWTAALALGVIRICEGRVTVHKEVDERGWLVALAAVLGEFLDDEDGHTAAKAGRELLAKLHSGTPACRINPVLLDVLTDFGALDEQARLTELGHEARQALEPWSAVDLVDAQRICHLRITLRYVRPSTWRKVLVPATFTLGYVHQIVQVALGWDASCPHLFTVGRKHFEATDHDELSIGEAFTVARRTIIYDFGADRHEITLERTEDPVPGQQYPYCTAASCPCDRDEVNRELAWLGSSV
nr:hypothetical protein [uncultured bacterium]